MNVYAAISANIWKTNILLALFIIFAGTLGYFIGEVSGYGPPLGYGILIAAMIYGFISFFFSDKVVLSSTGSKEIVKEDHPELFRIVENLALGNGMPMPKIYIIQDPAPNAFATGRDPKHASVSVTTGILNLLDKAELEGVIAHELSHIKNYDTRIMALTAVLIGSIITLSDVFMRTYFWGRGNRNAGGPAGLMVVAFLLAIATPLASLMQLAISRKREFLADASGVLLTRYPEGLATALEKISADPNQLSKASHGNAHLFIANPFKDAEKKSRNWINGLFSTHPPAEERIKILRSM